MARTVEVAPKERGQKANLTRVGARQRGQAPVEQPLQPFEILRRTFANQMPAANASKFAHAVAVMAKKGLVKPLQIGNTVFLLFPKAPGVYEFHTATVESADKQIARFKMLPTAAKQLGAKKLTSFFQDPVYNRIAKLTGLPWKISMSQQVTADGARPSYKVEIDL